MFYIFFAKYLFPSINNNTKHTINEPKIHFRIIVNHNINLFCLLFDLNAKHIFKSMFSHVPLNIIHSIFKS